MYRSDAHRLATSHTRFLTDSRKYASAGEPAAAKRKVAQARRVERGLLELGHRVLVGYLVELSALYERLEGSEHDRPELRARVLSTQTRIAALTA